MGYLTVLSSLCLASIYTQPTHAFWRLACSVSQTSRIDPILSPGSVSGHVHKFAGGNNVNQNSDYASLQASTCSTCEVQADKSAYWTPQLYYQHGNGTFEEVQNNGMTVYYVGRGGNASNTVPFPVGFKMISGNSILRHYDNTSMTYQNTRPIADRVSFRCINEANNIPETHYIGQADCVNGLRAQLNFQSCWDGVNLYKADQSHVAYLSGIDFGSCPPTHPVPIPGLFYEVLYWSNRIDQTDGGRFVFSNGDTTGYSFHGDFLNGWDQDVQTQAVQQCLYVDNGGVVAACPPLAIIDDANFPRNCPQSPPVINEAYTGLLPTNALPGCNPVTSGPADTPQVVCAVNSTVTVGTMTTGTSVAPYTGTYSPVIMSTTVTVTAYGTSGFSKTLGTFTQIPTSSAGVFAQGASGVSSSSATASSSASPTQTPTYKTVSIVAPGYTTLVIVVPNNLNPWTSFADASQASSYIAALTSIAGAEAATTQPVISGPPTSFATVTVTITAACSSPTGSSKAGAFYTQSSLPPSSSIIAKYNGTMLPNNTTSHSNSTRTTGSGFNFTATLTSLITIYEPATTIIDVTTTTQTTLSLTETDILITAATTHCRGRPRRNRPRTFS